MWVSIRLTVISSDIDTYLRSRWYLNGPRAGHNRQISGFALSETTRSVPNDAEGGGTLGASVLDTAE